MADPISPKPDIPLPEGFTWIVVPDETTPGNYIWRPIADPSYRRPGGERDPREFDPYRQTPEERALDRAHRDAELELARAKFSNDVERQRAAEERLADIQQAQVEIQRGQLSLDTQKALDRHGIDLRAIAVQEQTAEDARKQSTADIALKRGIATGNIDGTPTLEREKYEAEAKLANQPGNYFNYAFRSRGQEPPSLPRVAANLPQGRPWWENYSLDRLERFPDEELANLPKNVLSSFRNEFLLKRPALLALLPSERVQGSGTYQGTGFAQDVIDKYGRGAPAPPLPKEA